MRYRTPNIEEFHQGFKYQIAHDQQMVIWDAKNGVTEEFEKTRIWFDRVVFWMGEPKDSFTEEFTHYVDTPYGSKEQTSTITVDVPTYDFFYRRAPFNIESMLEQKLIRVKCTN